MKFPFSEDVRNLVLETINRLVNLKKSTPRLRLRQHLKGQRDVFDELLSHGYFVVRERDNYVPGIMAFEACGDDFLLNFAKESADIVLHTLQRLYETESPQTSFTVQEIAEYARRLHAFNEEEKICLGLSLVADQHLMVLGGWSNEDAVITQVHVREDIIDFTNIGQFWSQAVKARLSSSVAPKANSDEQRRMDPLLGICDRGEFEKDVVRFSKIATEDKPTSLIMGDVDNFKAVNDSPGGHLAGDEVLQTVAKTLSAVCDGKGCAYRYGGDEFAMLLPNFSLEEAAALAERICGRVSQAKFDKYTERITTSWGVAVATEAIEDSSELTKLADDALYRAKNSGKNRVAIAAIQADGEPETVSNELPASQEAIDVRIDGIQAQMFSIILTNNADQPFVINGVIAQHDGSALGKINRPEKGWVVPARGCLVVSWPPNNNVSGELVRLVGQYKQQYSADIDFVFHCRVASVYKEFRKRIRVQVDPINKHLF
jgi:diguanylate cyclase (GGDEF)-like protein